MSTTQAGPVYDTYWRFAAARHEVYLRRLTGEPPPWTCDPIISSWRFTNPYRAADRVSQYLIRNVIYCGSQDAHEVLFRILLFRWFNKIDTWELLLDGLGDIGFENFQARSAERILSNARATNKRVYSAAYIVPPVPDSAGPKHAGHIDLTIRMIRAGVAEHLQKQDSLRGVFECIRSWPGIGNFLAYQLAIDINYSEVMNYDEDDFVVPGPGALDGISKAWPGTDLRRAADIVRRTAAEQEERFDLIGVDFPGLFGRPLKLIDCQNLYCEISKYSRISHPEIVGVAKRSRIKQTYSASSSTQPLPPPYFPPKWKLRLPQVIEASTNQMHPLLLDLAIPGTRTRSIRAELAESYGS